MRTLSRCLTAAAAAALLLLAPTVRAADAADPLRPFVEQNCMKCHNADDWAGGLAFDTLAADAPATHPDVWEKAVRKLRGRLMPPPGQPQPDPASLDRFVSWMEGTLDRAAADNPDPGHVVLHRLNRTEYARAVEELTGVRVDPKLVLPKDVSSDGFDNVAAVLKTSPAFLEQYIAAARSISRQAVTRPVNKPASRYYRHPGTDQRAYVAGLPLGTRGGMVVEHYFPADGDYDFSITDFHFAGAGYVNRVDAPHRVIMTVDGARVFEQVVGGPDDLKLVDQTFAMGEGELQRRFNHIRVPVKAGTHHIGVAFVMRSMAESDSPLQPVAMLPEMERFPYIPGLNISGPFDPHGASETATRQRVFSCRPEQADDELPCARQILRRLAQQAYRRPVNEEDLRAPLEFYARGRSIGGFDAGIEGGLTAILSSTNFLFRAESVPEGAKPGAIYRVDDLALASRLSFFLWSKGPDEQLMRVATEGGLRDPKLLQAQVRRMLSDPRSDSLVTNFAFQWLNVNRIDSIEPDPLVYPDFDRDLREGFREEIRLFLDSVLRADRSVLDLMQADYSFVNERVALHYGIPNVRGAQFRRVVLADPNRYGLFGKGAVLLGTAYGNRTSPVLRGAWILESITGTPPASPPLGVEAFKESEPGKKVLTVRERLEAHRAAASCGACHGIIDPLGLALENYDVTGAWRSKDRDAGTKIEADTKLPTGQRVNGPAELRKALLARPDQFVQTLTEKLLIFALGRNVEHQDMPLVRAITRDAAKNGYRFESIVQGIVASDAFQKERVPASSVPVTTTATNLRE